MIANIKCLGTLLLAIFNTLLLLELCECKPNFGIDVIDEADTTDNADDKLTAAVGPSLAHEEESHAPKRAWSNFNSWGKRSWDRNFAVWGKRGWGDFAAWGKREPSTELSAQTIAQSEPAKRGWSNFASWGKRADGDHTVDDVDKRKWSNFQVWGKRNKEDYQDQLNVDKKWSQFATWGKRGDDEAMNPEKRKWSQFNTWGKRSDTGELLDKRKWAQFNAWGKRGENNGNSQEFISPLTAVDGNAVEISPDKRKWSQFASWGKRLRNAKTWAALNPWDKRRWSGLVTWGKRSVDMTEPNTRAIAQKLLQYFDENGDGTLDITELITYLETLTSLPSSQHVDKAASEQMM